jgi:hypothetical protein
MAKRFERQFPRVFHGFRAAPRQYPRANLTFVVLPLSCCLPVLVLYSTTIWMSEFLQVPILQAVRAALPQGLILCTDIICPAFTDRWKCDFHLKSTSSRSAW